MIEVELVLEKGYREYEDFKDLIQREIKRRKKIQVANDFLIGEFDIDPYVYEYLINKTHDYFKIKKATNYSKKIYLPEAEKNSLITFALVFFSKYDFQSNFWDEFCKKIKHTKSKQSIIQTSYKCFKKYCKKHSLFIDDREEQTGYVTSIHTHAIIQESNTKNIFRFIDLLYFNYLDEKYLEEDINRFFNVLSDNFDQYISHQIISLNFKNKKFTVPNQFLSKSFRLSFIHSKYVKELLKRCLVIIDKFNFGNESAVSAESKFEEKFIEYLLNSESEKTQRGRKIVKKTIKQKKTRAGKYSKQPRYYLENNQLYLFIPSQIIPKDISNTELFFNLYEGDTLLYQENAVILDNDLFYKTEEKKIKIENFSRDLNCTIHGEDLSLKLKKPTDSSFLFFDEEGNQISENVEDRVEIKILCLKNTDIEMENVERDIIKKGNYKIMTIFLKKKSLLYLGERLLSTEIQNYKTEVSEEELIKGTSVSSLEDDYKYEVYREIPEITLRIQTKQNIGDFIIRINEEKKELKDHCTYEEIEIYDGSSEKALVINLDGETITSKNPLRMIIYDRVTQKQLIKKNCFILKELHFSFDKNVYIKNKHIESSPKAILEELTYKIGETNNILQKPCEIDLKSHDYYSEFFVYKGRKYKLYLYVPFLTWEFAGIKSSEIKSQNIWYKDLKKDSNMIYINSPVDIGKLSINDEKLRLRKNKNGIYSQGIGNISKNSEIAIDIQSINYPLFRIYRKTTLLKAPLIMYSKENNNNGLNGLTVLLEAIGDKNIFLEVRERGNKRVLKRYNFKQKCKITDASIFLQDRMYELEFYIENESFFEGVQREKLYQVELKIGDTIFKAKNCYCFKDSQSKKLTKYRVSNFYLKIKDYDDSQKKCFGDAYFLENQGNRKKTFNLFNPMCLLKCEKQKSIYEIESNSGDGLIYDTQTEHINRTESQYSQDGKRYKVIETIELEMMEG